MRASQQLRFERIIPISAHERRNVDEAKRAIRDVLDVIAERELTERSAADAVDAEASRRKQ